MNDLPEETDELPADIVERLRKCKNLPTLPKAAMRIIQVAQMPEIDMGVVADSVSADPAIAAKVMRIANSALYARRRESTNLRQALITLGLNATLTLALSFTLVNKLREDPVKGFDFNRYWKRSILAGSWSRMLASEKDLIGSEEMFLVALLQDIGMLAIDRIAPDVYENISPFDLDHETLLKHEQNFLGVNHAQVGAWLMRDWKMPDTLSVALQNSHDCSAGNVDEQYRDIVKVTALSGRLADTCCEGHLNELDAVGKLVAKHMGIGADALANMYDKLLEQIPEAESVFETTLMPAEEIESLMDTARETLLIRNLNVFSQAAELVERAESLQSENNALKHENRVDELTGAFNRRAFEDSLNEEFDFSAKHSSSLSLIFVDIDMFKQANDTHGHVAGDSVLKAIASMLADTVRDSDVVARYGGDEFVLILPGTDGENTARVAGRIVENARQLRVEAESGEVLTVTLSLGTATQDPSHDFKTAAGLVRAADAALYDSKRKGRDCHTAYESIAAA